MPSYTDVSNILKPYWCKFVVKSYYIDGDKGGVRRGEWFCVIDVVISGGKKWFSEFEFNSNLCQRCECIDHTIILHLLHKLLMNITYYIYTLCGYGRKIVNQCLPKQFQHWVF